MKGALIALAMAVVPGCRAAQPRRSPGSGPAVLRMAATPDSGSGLREHLEAQFHDSKGVRDLAGVNIRIPSAVSALTCWIAYNPRANDLSLADDRGANWSHATPGKAGVLQNGACSLDLARSSVETSGDTLVLNLALTYNPAFAGFKTVYLRAQTSRGLVADYAPRAKWNVPGRDQRLTSVKPLPLSTAVFWPDITEFHSLAAMGFNIAILTVNPANVAQIRNVLEAAAANGIKLVIGAYPPPYMLHADGKWSITDHGQAFLTELARHASLVEAVYVFNEPYWITPWSGQANSCGALSADELRALRVKIRSVWARAPIYHDIGDPGAWAPDGSGWKTCIGDKYADQNGIADYVGIWSYPFTHGNYNRQQGLDFAYNASRYVEDKMGATPIFLAQSFACTNPGCASEGLTMPTASQLKDWNCSLRSVLPKGSILSWYVWRQSPLYSDYLANHPELWRLTTPFACSDR